MLKPLRGILNMKRYENEMKGSDWIVPDTRIPDVYSVF
jgi:hypothetical protein